jgi:exopolysaccharide biosynthesis polyprenyl glycosylphosphotransferase
MPAYENNRNYRIIDTKPYLNGITRKKTSGMRNTLIVGWNREALALCEKIIEYPALGYNVRGFITLKEKVEDVSYIEVPLLGGMKSLLSWVQLYGIDEILIAIEPEEQVSLHYIIDVCKRNNLKFKIVSDVYDTVYGNVIHDVYKELFTPKEFGLRRLIDFIGGVILLILFLPLFIIIALAIKLETKGPVFYSQVRVGKDNKQFRIYKFRSMVKDAEKKSGPVWAQRSDPRVTKIGHLMRATRIDELPQLINILKGDMSFVGPRPERPFFIESFKEQIPLYENRLKVKPGITGWAQVKWRYDETIEDVKEKLNYDLYYINNHSLWLDLKIFLLTIPTVVLQKGY